jgi:hypothetical protein
MKGGSGIEVCLYDGIGATLWLSAFVDATLRLLACKMTDFDALVLILIVCLHNSNPVNVASLEDTAFLLDFCIHGSWAPVCDDPA